jgi:geranylgeranyl pyrophosphate synthase
VDFDDVFSLLPPLRADIDRVIAVVRRSLSGEDGLMAEAVHHLIEAQGGYARPALVLTAAYATQSSNDLDAANEAVITGAAAVELLNLGTLYQDDVIDHDDVRRGVPSANAKWGDGPAIVAGDHLMFTAVRLSLELGPAIVADVVDTACALFRGEMKELEDRGNLDAVETDYLKTVSGKQASLLATACKLGAALSDGGLSAVQALERYGYKLGMAGQIIDDILDITATQEFLGKPVGSDLRGGIYTLPIIYALRRSADLRKLLSCGIDDSNLSEAKRLIVSSGAIEEARRTAEEHVREANASLAAGRLNERVTKVLSAFAEEILTGACWRG